MSDLTSTLSAFTSLPKTRAMPPVGLMRSISKRIVVVFPAPFLAEKHAKFPLAPRANPVSTTSGWAVILVSSLFQ